MEITCLDVDSFNCCSPNCIYTRVIFFLLFSGFKIIYRSEEWCVSSSQVVHLILFSVIGVGNSSGWFQFYGGLEAFSKILKMFYPPEGVCGAEPERGPIVFTLYKKRLASVPRT